MTAASCRRSCAAVDASDPTLTLAAPIMNGMSDSPLPVA